MLRFVSYCLLFCFVQTSLFATEVNSSNADGLIAYKSHYSQSETLARLNKMLKSKKFKVFRRVEHSKAAKKQGIELKPMTLLIFGKPSVGSRLMQCQPSVAIDLPQKALVWTDDDGQVWLSINQMSYLSKRHNMSQCSGLVNKVSKALESLMHLVVN